MERTCARDTPIAAARDVRSSLKGKEVDQLQIVFLHHSEMRELALSIVVGINIGTFDLTLRHLGEVGSSCCQGTAFGLLQTVKTSEEAAVQAVLEQ